MNARAIWAAASLAVTMACSPQNGQQPHRTGAEITKQPSSSAPTALAPAETVAMPGPFGIVMGEDISKLDASPLKIKPTFYEIPTPPRPNPDFAKIVVQA